MFTTENLCRHRASCPQGSVITRRVSYPYYTNSSAKMIFGPNFIFARTKIPLAPIGRLWQFYWPRLEDFEFYPVLGWWKLELYYLVGIVCANLITPHSHHLNNKLASTSSTKCVYHILPASLVRDHVRKVMVIVSMSVPTGTEGSSSRGDSEEEMKLKLWAKYNFHSDWSRLVQISF